MKKYIALICLALVLVFPAYASSAQDTPFAQTPVIFVDTAWSSGAYLIDAVCKLAGFKFEYDWSDMPYSNDLAAGVGFPGRDLTKPLYKFYTKGSNVPIGTKYNTLVLTMGGRITTDGIGQMLLASAGGAISLDLEIWRIKDNIKWAKENNVTIIGMHVEGASMRGKPNSGIEMIIDLVAPQCDMLIVLASSNQDGKFTEIAEVNNIPIEIAANARDLAPIIQKVFGLQD